MLFQSVKQSSGDFPEFKTSFRVEIITHTAYEEEKKREMGVGVV